MRQRQNGGDVFGRQESLSKNVGREVAIQKKGRFEPGANTFKELHKSDHAKKSTQFPGGSTLKYFKDKMGLQK